MSTWMIVVTGLMYFYISVEQAIKDNFALSIMYGAYAVANIGLYMMASK